MKTTSTGIAVAIAVVLAIIFVLWGATFFGTVAPVAPANQAEATTTTDSSATAPGVVSVPADALTTTVTKDNLPTQLTVSDTTVGTGATAKAGDAITVQYIGTLPDGTVFDASKNHGDAGFSFNLGAGQVIQGWDQGIIGMKEGGTRILIIPPAMGYGAAGSPPVIPPNATLIFQVELVKIGK